MYIIIEIVAEKKNQYSIFRILKLFLQYLSVFIQMHFCNLMTILLLKQMNNPIRNNVRIIIESIGKSIFYF